MIFGADEWFSLAARARRETFVAQHAYPFLVGRQELVKPEAPGRTVSVASFDGNVEGLSRALDEADRPRPTLVLPVTKTRSPFPSMITVGRTANNDVVLPDKNVSRFHAFFRILDDGGIELADAGSRFGTWVGEGRLEPKGAAVRVVSGMKMSFARLRFYFLDPAAAWERLRRYA